MYSILNMIGFILFLILVYLFIIYNDKDTSTIYYNNSQAAFIKADNYKPILYIFFYI